MGKINITSNGTYVVGDDDKIRIEVPNGGDVVLVADPDDEVEEIRVEFKVGVDLAFDVGPLGVKLVVLRCLSRVEA